MYRPLFSLEWFARTRYLCSRSTPVSLFWESVEKHAIILVRIFLLQLAERRRTSTRTSRRDDWVRYFSFIERRLFSTNKLNARKSQNRIKARGFIRIYQSFVTAAAAVAQWLCDCENVADKLVCASQKWKKSYENREHASSRSYNSEIISTRNPL